MNCKLKEEIISTYYKDYKFFFLKPNVEGIGFGYKYKNGICTCEPCIHVFVSKKVTTNCLQANGVIPKLYKGIKTDVIQTGVFSIDDCNCGDSNAYTPPVPIPQYVERIRPIQAGYCVSSVQSSPMTTFGYIVTDNEQVSRTYCLLGTSYGFSARGVAPIGTEIVQPATAVGGRAPNDVVATLLRFSIIKSSNGIPNSLIDFNTIDSAIASYVNVGEVQLLNPRIPHIGILRGITTPEVLKSIQWTGCISGNQKGTILSVKAMIKLKYFMFRDSYFKDIAIAGGERSYGGDLGALVCDINKNAMGMLFNFNREGTTVYNLICTMDNIQSELNVTLLTLKNING